MSKLKCITNTNNYDTLHCTSLYFIFPALQVRQNRKPIRNRDLTGVLLNKHSQNLAIFDDHGIPLVPQCQSVPEIEADR